MATKQGGTTEAGNTGMPENLRQAAETTIAQAKQAVDQYIRAATDMYEKVEASAEAAQAGARDVSRKTFRFAEDNINATLDFAQQLVRAQSPQDLVALQQGFLQQQLDRLKSQAQEIGATASKTAGETRSAARRKS
ncbi:phasin family protein [Microvirga massiliensis]|uniref:phasin family protein n=1 Tax=Microvirga massiliensis TaxID=1033741 RepID=UPI0006603E95|nr:phasin family protein [Microvirga massiliensis]